MGSYTVSPYPTAATWVLIYGSPAAGDQIVLTVDGVDVPYTVKSADLLQEGFFLQGVTNWAAAVNASTVRNPVHGLPMNQVIFASPGLGNNVGVRYLLWLAIGTEPQFKTAATVKVRFVPVHSAADAMLFTVLQRSTDQLITVTEPIAAGTVLTTVIDGTTMHYTVTAADTAASIASKAAAGLTSHLWSTRVSGNTITAIAGESTGSLVVTTSMTVPAAKPTLYVSGRFLYDRHGNKVILRGVDYPLADDYNFPGSDFLSEIAQSGANAIRIQWYMNYFPDPSRAPALTPEALGGFLDRCIAANLVPIVMISDKTSDFTSADINTDVIPWWTSAEVKGVMQARQKCLILNLANELGAVRWSGGAEDSDAYISAFKTAIATMRAAGYTMPLMVDAPDGGSTIDEFTSRGAELIAADPLGNTLLSVHAYWAGYDGRPYLATAVAANLPIVFGEIANFQDEVDDQNNTEYCFYALDGTGVAPHAPNSSFTYQGLLTTLVTEQIGWLAWCWTNDLCAPRQMTPTGKFAELSPYGNDLVHNPIYGLKATALKITP